VSFRGLAGLNSDVQENSETSILYDGQNQSGREIWLIQRTLAAKVIANLNGQEIKIIKAQGEFPWHHHENEDEFFMLEGTISRRIQRPHCRLGLANAW